MKLPKQAKPIMRKVSTKKITFSDSLRVSPQARFECSCEDSNNLTQRLIAVSRCIQCNSHQDCNNQGYSYCSDGCCFR